MLTSCILLFVHPVTGRKCLYVNEGFTVALEGLPEAESAALLQELYQHIVRPAARHQHNWRVGDLLMWDNCATQHCAVANYTLPLRRRMQRATVAWQRAVRKKHAWSGRQLWNASIGSGYLSAAERKASLSSFPATTAPSMARAIATRLARPSSILAVAANAPGRRPSAAVARRSA
ncbi:MAG: TauD/TfdA family dioxygenase [Blastocatellia bacterium]